MKQKVTLKQLNELNDVEWTIFFNWLLLSGLLKPIPNKSVRAYRSRRYRTDIDIVTIGYLIEFIIAHNQRWRLDIIANSNSVCDDLWDAVRSILKQWVDVSMLMKDGV